MILKDLKIFSQNIQKNNFLINTVLEVNQNFDIIFIQEPLWTILRTIPSSTNSEGIPLLGVPNYPNWLTFTREPCLTNDSPRVIIYINVRLSSFCFSLHKDIINHCDILLASFLNNSIMYWIMNIYSDSSHSTLKYLKDTEVNIPNLLIITGNFNIRDSIRDPSFLHYSAISDNLITIADSFNLDLSFPTHYVPTRYSDMAGKSNSVIDLMFLQSGLTELNNHLVHPDWCLSLDYAPLTVSIAIDKENINLFRFFIVKNSEEEVSFIKEVKHAIKSVDISDISNPIKLEETTNSLTSKIEYTWRMNSKRVNIMKHSKSWWNEECRCMLNKYRVIRNLKNWKRFKSTVKTMKWSFFNTKIQEIINKKQGPWELMSWVNKYKLPAIETIKYHDQQYLNINDLWNALHFTFNTALYCQVDIDILDEITNKPTFPWPSFSKEEFRLILSSCNNSSVPSPDKLMWSHLKIILKDDEYLNIIIHIANTCIELGYWSLHFKRSTMIVIPKLNKKLYNSSKLFRLIIFLNTVGKLIEKVIGERLQFNMTSNNFIHPSQLSGLKFKSTIDVGIALTHIIRTGWTKNMSMSILAFDISQFFLSLNHQLLTLIIKKAGFNNHVVSFFANYLVDRKTNYYWNNFMSPIFNINIGVGQGSVLLPILSALYILLLSIY